MAKLMALVAALLVSACASSYDSFSWWADGGYSETQLDENVFTVAFNGNAYTKRERVADFTLLRSAELSLEHGYKFFAIIDAGLSQRTSTYVTPTTQQTTSTSNTTANAYAIGNHAYGNATTTGTATTTTYGGQVFNIVKPSASNTIICYKEKPENVFTYSAEFLYRTITQKYDIKPKTK